MTRYVIDANVAIKWFLPLSPEVDHLIQAMQILNLFMGGKIACFQPPHFITEVLGVLTRLRPEIAEANLTDLLNLDFQRVETEQIYATACSLSIQLKQHLFDTLYHASALEINGAIFITADTAYYRKAKHLGRILLLQNFNG